MVQKLNDTQVNGFVIESINQAKTLVAFGDSITAGSSATTLANQYPSKIAAAKGWTLNNLGVSGMRMNDPAMIDNMYAQVVTGGNYTLLSGVNDARTGGTNLVLADTFRGCLQAGIAWLAIPDAYKVKAANATRAGTWATNGTISNSMDYTSTTNGSTITAKVRGTTAYVGYIRSAAPLGVFNVTIDGVDMGNVNTSYSTPTRQAGDLGAYAQYLLRYPNLTPGEHTIVITVTSATGAGNAVYIDWFGGNGFHRDAMSPSVWVGNCLRASDAYYSANPPHSEASASLYNSMINEAINSLAKDGLQVCLVDVVDQQDRAADLAADGLHPNDTGHDKIAQLFLRKMSSVAKANDKGMAAVSNTPWIPVTYLNGWVDYSTAFDGASYMKDSSGVVHLRGVVKSGTVGSTTPIFILPQGFRPRKHKHAVVASNTAFGIVEMRSNGEVVCTFGNTAYASLDNLHFLAEQ
jgi:lysophospholipase L1-like esterase